MLDAVILGATEADVNYTGNVGTHSGGYYKGIKSFFDPC
jgi:hypothetical protein